jgi:phenylalanyl-tRNA synthetase beta chain
MQISLKWVNELVNIEKINLDRLVEKLTLGGFEVEEILEVEINRQKQIVLDISATANRSDSLSIYGISTEIAALLDQPLRIPKYTLKTKEWNQLIEEQSETFSDDSNCSMLLGVIVENLTSQTSPKWIKDKLLSSGVIPSNDFFDFQNYILLETGYPFEFYDLEKVQSKLATSEFHLSIEEAKNNQNFFASNKISYELDPSILTIKANETPLSIAGIIGAQNFLVSESTSSLLIEGSIFKAGKIRQQSRKLGLRTDRSARYEKSIRTTYLKESFYRLLSLLRMSNPNLTLKLHTIKQISENSLEPILLRYETINEILGPINLSTQIESKYISRQKIDEYLTRLNFKFTYDNLKDVWQVKIPHLRTEDIVREIDLIEEIGRLHGFNNFLTTLPKISTVGNEDSHYKLRKKITTCLLNLGLNECIHYSLVNPTTFLTNEIELVNPLLADCSNLRRNLLPNLIKTVQENLKQKNLSIEVFEYGHVFSSHSKTNFEEKEHVAGIFGGLKSKLSWTDSEIGISWFEAKGKIEQLFEQLNFITCWKPCFNRKEVTLLHPYRSAEIFLDNGTSLGIFGQIHPLLAKKLKFSSEIYLFEFDLEVIELQIQKNKLTFYKSYSLYPKIIKDLSFIIQKDISFEKIRETLYYNGTEFLSEINLLDEYQGHSIPPKQTSLCLQFVFQSNTRTLETKEIENIIQQFKTLLVKKFNANIRN